MVWSSGVLFKSGACDLVAWFQLSHWLQVVFWWLELQTSWLCKAGQRRPALPCPSLSWCPCHCQPGNLMCFLAELTCSDFAFLGALVSFIFFLLSVLDFSCYKAYQCKHFWLYRNHLLQHPPCLCVCAMCMCVLRCLFFPGKETRCDKIVNHFLRNSYAGPLYCYRVNEFSFGLA